MTSLRDTKNNIKKAITAFLYEPAQKKIKDKFDLIANSFAVDSKHREPAFMYKGEVYFSEGFRPVRGNKVGLLPKRLYDHMEKWLADVQDIKAEEFHVQGFLSCALIEANNTSELKELLPSCVHACITAPDEYKGQSSLSLEEVARFHETHANHIQKIKERVVLNMIT